MPLTLAHTVHTYSTGTLGRAICNARTHHFVSDDVGGDAVGAGELFLSGVSACAVNMVERLANQDKIPLQWMDVSIEAYRDPGCHRWRHHGLRCHPGALRDVGRAGRACRRPGRDLETALPTVRLSRHGDQGYACDSDVAYGGTQQIGTPFPSLDVSSREGRVVGMLAACAEI